MLIRLAAAILLLSLPPAGGVAQEPPKQEQEKIDFAKARELMRRKRAGETLTAEEEKYLERARAERGGATGAAPAAGGKASTGLVPLPEMAAADRYKEQDGGLYGEGRNEPPEAHLAAALAEAAKIVPLDAEGKPAADGKIGLVSIGMSNTTQEFSRFVQLARAELGRATRVAIVDGAQGGRDSAEWVGPSGRPQAASPWDVLVERLKAAEVAPAQVQVAWIKQARKVPSGIGEFPKHADALQADLAKILGLLRERYPNVRIAYLSNRIYAGHATGNLNPEPYAYESAFAVRGLIREQIKGAAALNWDPAKGAVKAPLALWGPYLWADGDKPRKSDGLVYLREDLAGDGTHPSNSGREKVARQLLAFLKSDATAKPWFK